MQENYKFAQRVKRCYVQEDCIQMMVTHYYKNKLLILSDNEIMYGFDNNGNVFNTYVTDYRKDKFPFSNIPIHISRKGLYKYRNVNQIFNFNKIYIIFDQSNLYQCCAIKDQDEALLVTKGSNINRYLEREYIEKKLDYDELVEFLDFKNNIVFNINGILLSSISKEDMLVKIRNYYSWIREAASTYEIVEQHFLKGDISDIKHKITVSENVVISKDENGQFNKISIVKVTTNGTDKFTVRLYDIPLLKGITLNEAKCLETVNFKETKEPKISRRLNKKIDKKDIKKEQNKVLQLTKK